MQRRLEVGRVFIEQGSIEACIVALYGGDLMIVGGTGALLRNKTREEKRADGFGTGLTRSQVQVGKAMTRQTVDK